VNNASKLVLSFILLAALAGGAAFLWLRPAAPAPLPLEPEQAAAVPLETPRDMPVDAESALASEAPGSERTRVPKEAKPSPPPGEPAAQQSETLVIAHIVDENLRPIANAWLRPKDDNRAQKNGASPDEARTGADGVATLHWKGGVSGQPLHFSAGAERYATIFPNGTLKAGETLHLGDLTLHPGGSVRGRVVDSEQHPVAGAEVVVADEHEVWGTNDLEQLRSRGPSTWLGAPQTKSAEDGSFLVEGVVAGMTRAWAKRESSRWAVSEPLELQAGGEGRDVVLVLDPEDKSDPDLRDIEGIVVSPEDKPIPSARMQVRQEREGSSWSSGSKAEADGRFRVHPQERGIKITLEFSDPDEHYMRVRLDDVKPGTKDLVVRLEEPQMVALSVRDEHGPVEDFRVRWGNRDWDLSALADKKEAHANGQTLVRVPTRATFWYQVEAPGHMSEKLGPLDGSKPLAELAVKLRTIPGIHGRVLAGEKPVQDAKVALHEHPQDARIEMNGFATRLQTNAQAQTTSSSDGRFTLELQKDGRFSILAEADGYARAEVGPLLLEAQAGLQDLVIQLDAGGTLEGKVLMPPGRSPAGVIVGINRGDTHPSTRAVGPDGSFRFEHLTAGDWEIKRTDEMFHGATSTSVSSGDGITASSIRHDFSISVGQATHHDLDLRDSQPCVLEIVLTNNGQPARAWSIVGWPKDQHTFTGSPPSGATDSNGHARLSFDDPCECQLTISTPAEAGSSFQFRADVVLQRGPNDWNQDLRTGRVEGTIAGWQPEAGVHWRLESEGSGFQHQELRLDASGHFSDPYVQAGKVSVLRMATPGTGRSWDTVQTLVIAAGETQTLQLP